MKAQRSTRWLTLGTCALLVCGAANSTTLARMSVAQMARAAQLVVRARCVSNSTEWNVGEIWTFTSFDVEETWKASRAANVSSYLTVRLLGGTVGNLTSSVSGVPHFVPGEDVVLFLESTPRGDFSIVSWVQGTFRIRRDLRTGQQIAIQDTASFDTFEVASHQFRATGLRNVPIESLRAMVSAGSCVTAICAQGTK